MINNSFDKAERLCSKILITNLFSKGNRVITQFPFRVLWQFINDTQTNQPAQVLVSVSKRNFPHAVDRNRIKRQIRELYRTQKHFLYTVLKQANKNIVISITFQSKTHLKHEELNVAFRQMLQKIINQIEKAI
jgi:ribonuclease P protein component